MEEAVLQNKKVFNKKKFFKYFIIIAICVIVLAMIIVGPMLLSWYVPMRYDYIDADGKEHWPVLSAAEQVAIVFGLIFLIVPIIVIVTYCVYLFFKNLKKKEPNQKERELKKQ